MCVDELQAAYEHVVPGIVVYISCTSDIPHQRQIQQARHYSGARDEGRKMAGSTFWKYWRTNEMTENGHDCARYKK